MARCIADKYGLQLADAAAWYADVQIVGGHPLVSERALERALEVLCDAGVLPEGTAVRPEDLIDGRVAKLKREEVQQVRLYRSSASLLKLLHCNIERAGLSKGGLSFRDLLPFDQHHYGGVAAVDEALRLCNVTSSSRVINIGSGLGGAARYMAGTADCQVLACELQHELHNTAQALTDRCGLGKKVVHMAGDFCQVGRFLAPSSYGAIVSWLTVLHIRTRQRKAFFKECFDLLQPGGTFYAADFCRPSEAPLSVQDRQQLREDVYCDGLSSITEYAGELRAAGFVVDVNAGDCSDRSRDWTGKTAARLAAWKAEQDRICSTSGEKCYEQLLIFYGAMADLFARGRVGGIVICARKPFGAGGAE